MTISSNPGEDVKTGLLGADHADAILCYEDSAKDTLRSVSMTAERDSEEARRLVKAVLRLRPDTDIRHMEHEEALELMETRDYYRLGLIAGGVIVGVIVLVILIGALVEPAP